MWACTPLVIDPIGASAGSRSGHRSPNMSRLTSPWSLATPLDRPASRSPMTAMLNGSSRVVGGPVAEGDEVLEADADLLAPGAEVAVHQLEREPVDARRDRGVGGEDAPGPHGLDGLGVAEPLVDDELADALEAEEPGVALVGVEHLGLDADGLQRPDAADAEQDLLAQPVLGVAAVEAVGDLADLVGVLLDVGVEEVQRHPADARLPHLGHQRHAGQVDLDPDAVARGQRHDVRVEQRVALLLPAVGVEALAEVAVAVEQADARRAARRGRWTT